MDQMTLTEQTAPPELAGTPMEILSEINIGDYSQFLTRFAIGGNNVTRFSAEGVKTIALQFGISTGDVDIKFMNEEQDQALFRCTATNLRTGQTANVTVFQGETERGGRKNPFWIEKGVTRAIRNAQEQLLPIELLQTALQRAIDAGDAEKSQMLEAQKAMSQTWTRYAEAFTAAGITKPALYEALQEVMGPSENWSVEDWEATVSVMDLISENTGNWKQVLTETLT